MLLHRLTGAGARIAHLCVLRCTTYKAGHEGNFWSGSPGNLIAGNFSVGNFATLSVFGQEGNLPAVVVSGHLLVAVAVMAMPISTATEKIFFFIT